MSTLGRVAWLSALVIALIVPAVAQQPTDEQRNAIRSACRSDYEANCASVPPGGAASLQCLQKNMSKLSGACKQAVNAIEPETAAPKTETTTAPATPAPAKAATPAAAPKATTPPQKPTDAQTAAVRNACRSDYEKNCASVPPGGAASLQCLQKSMSKLSPGCQKAVSAVGGGGAGSTPTAAATAAPAADAPAPAPLVLRPMRPREELFVLRSACGADVQTLCGGVAPGGGRIVQCLAVRASSLSPACKDVLAQFAAQ
jgi:pyruvate/2-oxoglutarate dehydrogenase complex dihydrolipoamide acyltransferase (E2) component